jgi:hypothetical protein
VVINSQVIITVLPKNPISRKDDFLENSDEIVMHLEGGGVKTIK